MEVYGFTMLDMGHDFTSIDPNWFDTMRVTRAAVVRQGVRRRPQPLRRRTAEPARRAVDGADRSRRPEDHLRVRVVRHRRRRRTDDVPAAARMGRAGPAGRGSVPGAPSAIPDVFPNSLEYWGPTGIPWFRNVQLRWTPRSAPTRATSCSRSSVLARAAIRASTRTASSSMASARGSRCPIFPPPTSTRRAGAMSEPRGCYG